MSNFKLLQKFDPHLEFFTHPQPLSIWVPDIPTLPLWLSYYIHVCLLHSDPFPYQE